MVTMALEALFWGSCLVLAYVVALFPALIWARARFFPRPHAMGEVTPLASLIVAAHNEEDAIGAKIESILALDYPRDRLEVLVASDGSTDRTEEIAGAHRKDGIRLLALPRVGKAAALNAAAAAATGEVLVFSDANGLLDRGALRALMRPFADPEVGGVAGNQVYRRQDRDRGASGGELAYWSLDRRLKCWESAAGSVISATGALYAVRRSLFQPVPEGVTDDFVISTRVVAQRRRLVFAPEAVVWEPVEASTAAEFTRKVRIMTRGLQALAVMRELLDPSRHGFYAIQVLSHKLLRRLSAIPLLVLLIVTPFLWKQGPIYCAAAVAEAVIGGSALVGALLRGSRFASLKVFAVPLFFLVAHAASLAAVLNVIRGRRIDRWDPRRDGRGELPAEANGRGNGRADGRSLARHDWRFLLDDPRPSRVAAVGGRRAAVFEALALAGARVTVAPASSDSRSGRVHNLDALDPDAFDVVVAHEPTAAELAQAAALVRPGGVLYIEDHGLLGARSCGRGLRFRWPSTQAAALRALGFTRIEIHGHWPDFATCTRIVPLAGHGPIFNLVGARDRDGGGRLRAWIGWLLVRSGALVPLVPCYSVLARRPASSRGLKNPDGSSSDARGSFQPPGVAGGEG